MKKTKETIIESPNLSAALKPEHIGKWVALSSNYKKLLAVGETLSAVLRKAAHTPHKVVLKVLPNLGYAPNVR
ncbi:MAG TPA: hypothetical protein VJJ55_01190 [Candidatus Paceibacterota bacterium]